MSTLKADRVAPIRTSLPQTTLTDSSIERQKLNQRKTDSSWLLQPRQESSRSSNLYKCSRNTATSPLFLKSIQTSRLASIERVSPGEPSATNFTQKRGVNRQRSQGKGPSPADDHHNQQLTMRYTQNVAVPTQLNDVAIPSASGHSTESDLLQRQRLISATTSAVNSAGLTNTWRHLVQSHIRATTADRFLFRRHTTQRSLTTRITPAPSTTDQTSPNDSVSPKVRANSRKHSGTSDFTLNDSVSLLNAREPDFYRKSTKSTPNFAQMSPDKSCD
ncbi:hypothetical protein F511_35950 [Dorcoceras hygrometricum]|uniref:Uncharacterized protein n=1 Tax=Dorcoceras hygrometricum TaxID=472368 RepID=A0A2Z7AX55_9LAMI|nr:hypothetical protein F511_35950 [Dorcoceras hygrometricum]